MMTRQRSLLFSLFVGLTIVGNLFLFHALNEACKQEPLLASYWVTSLLPLLQGTLMIGIGLGLPLILLSGILGWGQLVLLMHGQISPHLGEEGLLKVFKTLFRYLFSPVFS